MSPDPDPTSTDTDGPLAGDGLFTAEGDEPNWSKAHRILTPSFGQRARRGHFDAMLEVALQLIASWEARQGQDLEVSEDMTRLTLDTIALCGFDVRFDSFTRPQLHPFLQAMARVLDEAMARLTRHRLVTRMRFASNRRFDADIAQMHALVDDVIRSRRASPREARDLLGLMLDAVDPASGERLDDEVLAGGRLPAYEDLARLEVIDRALEESLRLWPTAPGFAVAPYQDAVIGDRYPIPRNRRVTVPLPALHRDPAAWPWPEEFDIDRFLPESEARLPPHAYKPFGNGSRAGIGRLFAIQEAKIALALLLQRFELEDPYGYRLRVRETLTLKPEGFRLRVRRRDS